MQKSSHSNIIIL